MEEDKEKTMLMVRNIQVTVEQMKLDDIENTPDSAHEEFQCNCCGDVKELAGSMIYGAYLYCNDCVLLTEISLALGKITYPEEMLQVMEDKRFENLYNSIFNLPDVADN